MILVNEKKIITLRQLVNKKMQTEEKIVELYVEDFGWLTLLLDALEFVQDSWYNSTRYNRSVIEFDEENISINLKHVYKKNQAYDSHQNNQLYNLIFEEINIFADKIIAYR